MAADPTDSLERMSRDELIGLVRELLGEVARLRADNERLSAGLSKLQVEHQAVKDELARLKGLPPRPPVKPSGMEKATQAKGTDGEAGKKDGRSTRRCGSLLDRLTISKTVVIKAAVPTGSRHKGYEDIVVQDLNLQATVTRYRRERWETAAGENIVAELAPGIIGGYPLLIRRLDRYEPHRLARHRLANALRISRISLSAFYVRLDIRRRYQQHIVSKGSDLPSPIVRPSTSLHAHQTSRKLLEKLQNLRKIA